jgi:SpoIIAA-like
MEADFMAIQLNEMDGGKVLHVVASAKLSHQDYQRFVPEFERLIGQHGKIRILFEMADFHGWDAAAVWDDLKIDVKHFADIEKIAMVGDKKWEKSMSIFCKPFTTATIRYFDRVNLPEAQAWLLEKEL